MIAFDIIGHHFHSRLDIVVLGIKEAQVESVVNVIGVIPNGLGPKKEGMKIPPISLFSVT